NSQPVPTPNPKNRALRERSENFCELVRRNACTERSRASLDWESGVGSAWELGPWELGVVTLSSEDVLDEFLQHAHLALSRRLFIRFFQPRGARTERLSGRRAAPVLAQDPAREPLAARGRAVRGRRRYPGPRLMGREIGDAEGDRLHAGAGPAPGFHRR